jgi:hypothetical protein
MDLTKEKSIREVTKRESPPAISPEGLILILLATKQYYEGSLLLDLGKGC